MITCVFPGTAGIGAAPVGDWSTSTMVVGLMLDFGGVITIESGSAH
ncbi:MAG TPA: hypothetical protein VNO31_52695 [Umezawaea sp.]|nr:hypothetical protein [Umezawaea sp.]